MREDRPPPAPDDAAPVALVTGGARRIGRAICERLQAAGMRVVIHHNRSTDAARELAARLNEQRPDSALTVAADLTRRGAPEALLREASAWHDRLDLLVNNASSFYPTEIGQITERDWDDLVSTNLKAPLFLAQAAAPLLRRARGAIVNLADIHGARPLAGHAVYCTAKAGLVMLTKALARDLGPEVRVNAVSPGPILWPERETAEPGWKDEIIASTALGRVGDPREIADAVLFLARDAGYVTGQNLAVDGGRTLGP